MSLDYIRNCVHSLYVTKLTESLAVNLETGGYYLLFGGFFLISFILGDPPDAIGLNLC
jgi:hypothetical protein